MKVYIALLVAFIGVFAAQGCKGELGGSDVCVPQCNQRECGPDQCGGICGSCGPQLACNANGSCVESSCGNGVLDPGETCDPLIPQGSPGACLTTCEDDNPCTNSMLFGNPNDCDVECRHFQIIDCNDGDGCCPAGCTPSNDTDCSENCGDGVIDVGETCDPPETCPTLEDCEDDNPCTEVFLTGHASTCSAACAYNDIVQCIDGDGCCPMGCTPDDDDDCEPAGDDCGNGILDDGELCDPGIEAPNAGFCPTDIAQCDDQDPCTTHSIVGSAEMCTAQCQTAPVAQCVGADGCCLAMCTPANDADCEFLCDQWCDEVLANCTEDNEVFENRQACELACQSIPSGNAADMTGNTLYCRIYHANEAANDPATHCPAAGADGGTICE